MSNDAAYQMTQQATGRDIKMGEYQSGQMGQTVNLLVYTFGGSNPSSPTKESLRTLFY